MHQTLFLKGTLTHSSWVFSWTFVFRRFLWKGNRFLPGEEWDCFIEVIMGTIENIPTFTTQFLFTVMKSLFYYSRFLNRLEKELSLLGTTKSENATISRKPKTFSSINLFTQRIYTRLSCFWARFTVTALEANVMTKMPFQYWSLEV